MFVLSKAILLAATSGPWPFPVSPRLSVAILAALVMMVLLLLLGKVPLGYNVRNLMVRWKTTAMTALAFTLVVSLMTIMLAFVEGMSRLTEQSGQPGNVIVLADGATDETFSNLGVVDSSDVERQPGVQRNAEGHPLSSKETYIIINQPIVQAEGLPPRRRFVQLRGIEDPVISAQVHGLTLREGGNWFSTAGVEETDGTSAALIQAVVGRGLAGEMGGDRPSKQPLSVGDTFELGPRQFKIVGILNSGGSTFDSEIWAKRSLVGPLFGKENYSSIVLRTEGSQAAKQLTKDLKAYKKAALNAQTETDYFSKLGETSRQFLVAIVFVAIVMGVGGVFGVMNTMFAAISQRTKDIGVLRILGYRRRQILISFLLESMVIALIGGALGCALGAMADGWTAKSVVSSGQGGGAKFVVLELAVSADILATGLLLSLAMGWLGGFAPALSAMRLRPLESLR